MKSDVVIIGAGIVGLAHAWAAAKRGLSVVVVERSPYAQSASIRNFGMVWPIGQPAGQRYELALHSRSLWLEMVEEAGLWHHAKGSVHLALREDELAVMREFVDLGTHACSDLRMLNAEAALETCPAANRDNVIGGFFSGSEVGVDPRQAIADIPKLLAQRYGVVFHFNSFACRCDHGAVHLADGRTLDAAQRIVVCSGAETRSLFPNAIAEQDVVPCKLQMLATGPQPGGWDAGAMVASGTTLRHYEAFQDCPSLAAFKERVARETPELDELGIHFMAAQNSKGEVVLGDSHEYGDAIRPFDQDRIESLLLKGLHELLDLPNFGIARRWHGVYLKAPGQTHIELEPQPGVILFNGLGGAGMTLSFGLADRYWSE